jgi:hypothetical protein
MGWDVDENMQYPSGIFFAYRFFENEPPKQHDTRCQRQAMKSMMQCFYPGR